MEILALLGADWPGRAMTTMTLRIFEKHAPLRARHATTGGGGLQPPTFLLLYDLIQQIVYPIQDKCTVILKTGFSCKLKVHLLTF